MEVDEVQTQPSKKLSRLSDGRGGQNHDQKGASSSGAGDHGGGGGGLNRLRGWNPSSRIIRVSRTSSGKDRHSKVWTSKGLRDRRVRLSVSTAIQFYDLQDRLGYDQPSKAVEWLIKAAADAIAELPSINTSFPYPPNQLSDERMASNGGNEQGLGFSDLEGQNQTLSLSKSACSSNSETSKNSASLSLSRSEIRGSNRVKARERARERTAKEKEKERDSVLQGQNVQQNSFTQLLTAGLGNNLHDDANQTGSGHQNSTRQWNACVPVEYFSPVVHGSSSPSSSRAQQGYKGQIHPGTSIPQTMLIPPPFSISGDNHHHHHQEPLHQLSYVPDSLMQAEGPGTTGDYNTLNFSISSTSGLAGFNRGTLQSNSHQSLLLNNNFQRLSSSMEGQSLAVFMAAPPFDNQHNHHQFSSGLQLYRGDGSRLSDNRDKGKS